MCQKGFDIMLVVTSVSRMKDRVVILDTDDDVSERVPIDTILNCDLDIVGKVGDKFLPFLDDAQRLYISGKGTPVVIQGRNDSFRFRKQAIYCGFEYKDNDFIFNFYDDSGLFTIRRRTVSEEDTMEVIFDENNPVEVERLLKKLRDA